MPRQGQGQGLRFPRAIRKRRRGLVSPADIFAELAPATQEEQIAGSDAVRPELPSKVEDSGTKTDAQAGTTVDQPGLNDTDVLFLKRMALLMSRYLKRRDSNSNNPDSGAS